MNPSRRTQFLVLLTIVSAIAAGGAGSILNSSRESALVSQRDRAQCLAEISNLHADATAAPGGKPDSAEDHAINRRLRGAAVAARLTDQLVSIDAGTPARVRDSDSVQTPIYVRLNGISLKQLIGFLYELSVTDNALVTTDIELSPPLTMPANRTDPGDLWTADVTLSYLSYEQRQPAESR